MLRDYPVVLASFAAGAVWVLGQIVHERRKRRQLPPGPPIWPFIGSILSYPKARKWLTFTQWSRVYGNMVYVKLFSSDIIIINSRAVLSALFESPTRGHIYSDRPSLYFACELVGWKELPGLLDLGSKLTHHRRLMAQTIGTKALIADMQGLIEAQVLRFVRRLAEDSGEVSKLDEHSRILTGAITLAVTYGYDAQDLEDPFLKSAQEVVFQLGSSLTPGQHLADSIPLLRYLPSWLPGGGFKRVATRMRADRQQFMDGPHDWVQQELAKGTAKPSFLQRNLEGMDLTPDEAQIIKWTSTMLFVGGANTTRSALMTFLLCMLLHPEAQKRAHAELDEVLGSDHSSGSDSGPSRLPTSADRERLPYVGACLRESMRWHPVSPPGLVHRVQADDVFEHDGHQYSIPKDTLVMANIWAFSRDPETYSNPDSFKLERFLGLDAWAGKAPELDPREYVFGIGRRACPGQLLAENTLWTVASTVLALLDVCRVKDKDGTEVEVEVEYSGESTVFPKPFPVEFHLRSKNAEEQLRESLGEI